MKNKKTIIIIAIVAVILIGGFAYWWFSKSKPLPLPAPTLKAVAPPTANEIYDAKSVSESAEDMAAAFNMYMKERANGKSHTEAIATEQKAIDSGL